MVFGCDKCGAQYKIADEKVTGKGVRVKCKKCGNIVTVKVETVSAPAPAAQNIYDQQSTVVQRNPAPSSPLPDGGGGLEGEATRVVQMGGGGAGGVFSGLIDQARDPAPGDAGGGTQQFAQQSYQTEEQATSPGFMPPSAGSPPPEEDEDLGRQETRVFTQDDMARVKEERQMAGDTGSPGGGGALYFQSQPAYQRQPQTEFAGGQPYYSTPRQEYVSQKPAPAPRPRVRGEWYVAIGEVQVGPLSLIEVEEKWGRGEIDSTTLCWKAGFPDWRPLMYVPELAHLVPPAREPEPELPKPEVVVAPSAPSTPSLDEIAKAESEMPFATEGGAPADDDWKPSAGAALASLVEAELQSIKGGGDLAAAAAEDPLSGIGISPVPASTITDSSPFQSFPGAMPVSSVPAAATATAVTSFPGAFPSPAVSVPHMPSAYPTPSSARRGPGVSPILLAGLIAGAVLFIGGGAFAVYWFGFKESAPAVTTPAKTDEKKEEKKEEKQEEKKEEGGGTVSLAALFAEQQKLLDEKLRKEREAESEPAAEEKAQPEPEAPSVKKSAATEGGASKSELKKQKEEERKAKAEEAKRKKEEEKAAKAAAAAARKAEEEPARPAPKKGGKKGCDPVLDPDCESGGGGSEPPPPPPKKTASIPEALEQSQVLEVVKSAFPRIQNCAKQQAAKDPTLTGKMTVAWEIQRDGRTSKIKVETPKFQGTFVATCVSSVVEGFKFPKFSGDPIPVKFPFNIKGP